MINLERIQELGEEVDDLCMTFNDLPAYEVGARLIAQATRILLHCAPNQLLAIKTIMASIEIGISEYQEIDRS